MAKRGVAALWRMTTGEHRANVDGLNMFFGAVLGIVLSGTDALPAGAFALLLAISATAVLAILYVGASPNRLAYAAVATVYVALLPMVIGRFVGTGAVPPHLQPTLAVWLLFVLVVEFAPREKAT